MGTVVRKGRTATLASSAALLIMAGANGLIAVTADHGGALVYRHGVAVSLPPVSDVEEEFQPEPAGVSSRQQLTQGNDGSLHWRPSAIEGGSVEMVLRPAEGASAEVLKLSGTGVSDADGVRVEVSGSTVVCFPGVFGDVVMTTTVDLGSFEGVFGLGHHIQSVDEGVFFTVSTKGDAELFRRVDGESKAMDEGTAPLPAGLVTLRASVAGRHLKGQVGEATVVHGHGPSGEKGAVGLVLEGRGEVRIILVSVETSPEH